MDERLGHFALRKLHFMDFSMALKTSTIIRFERRIDARDADAMKSAGDFISVFIEFSAGVKDGHDNF